MSKKLSYYYPSTVVFVDDQQAFLTAIKNRLPEDMLALFFNNSKEALSIVQQENHLEYMTWSNGFGHPS